MEQEGLDRICEVAVKKIGFYKSKLQYFVYAMMAGCFCSIGMALAYSAGAGVYFTEGISGAYKLVIGITFALSFTLIVFAGAELFTGNVMVMTIGSLSKAVNWRDGASLLVYCYFANIFGAVLMGAIFSATGLLIGHTGELLVTSCAAKMALPFWQALFRGIMCNMLVCLGTWACAKLKSEVARMIILLWVIVGFVTPGYEHSIANAGLFTMAFLAPQTTSMISFAGVFSNIIPVTIGNVIGGGLFVGVVYWVSGKKKSIQGE